MFYTHQMTSDLEAAVLGGAWPCPEVSVHTCYTHTPGRRWLSDPEKEEGINLIMHRFDSKNGTRGAITP